MQGHKRLAVDLQPKQARDPASWSSAKEFQQPGGASNKRVYFQSQTRQPLSELAETLDPSIGQPCITGAIAEAAGDAFEGTGFNNISQIAKLRLSLILLTSIIKILVRIDQKSLPFIWSPITIPSKQVNKNIFSD